jgi:O-antigen/teichoic acid export membrane protein
LRDLLKAKTSSVLARNTLWMSLGQGSRLVIQAAYFTVIARSLGVANYGSFVGVVALVGILYPFATGGRGNVLIQNVARDRSTFSSMWGAALATVVPCGLLLLICAAILSHFALPPSIPLRLVVLVAAADIVGLNLVTTAGQAFQAVEQLGWTAAFSAFTSGARLIGALLVCTMYHSPTPMQWGYVYFSSTAIVSIIAVSLVTARIGAPQWKLPGSWREMREGFYFSVGLSAQTIYNDIDKTMLARLSTLTATGIYGAAYRIIDVSFSPVSALIYAAYPNFFKSGASGIGSSLAYARPLILRSVGYAATIAGSILLCAGIVPYLLGPQYLQTAEALRWLAPLPILKAVHYFLSDALSGAGYQRIRCSVQIGVALFNILINLWLIPAYSWRGAAWSSIASDALLAISIGGCALWLSRLERSATHDMTRVMA